MIPDLSIIKIFIQPGITDLRKQISGLSVMVQDQLKLNPFSGNLFLFCNYTRSILKILYWDKNGFCLWMKRLERDKFPWPKNQEEAREISPAQLQMILDGIDFWNAHKKLEYSEII